MVIIMKQMKKRMETVCIYVVGFISVSVFFREILEWLMYV